MMHKLKELYADTFKIAFPILWLYFFIVFFLQTMATNAGYSFSLAVFVGFISFVLTYFIFYFGGTVDCTINTPIQVWDKKSLYIACGVIFAITFLFFCGYFLCQYPGGSSPDVHDQYFQALNGKYCNWHPVIHTLLFFTIPLKILHLNFPLIVVLQLLYFSIAIAYLMSVLLRNGLKFPFLILFCIYIWINPYLATFFMYPWKDLAFTIFAVILVAQYIQIVCSRGLWFEKKMNLVLFSVVSVLCMYMRHNGVLLVGPLVAISLWYIRKNKRVLFSSIALILICALSVQGIYGVLHVERARQRHLESIGLPMTILCSVMQKTPQALPEETREIMYKFAAQEQYEKVYVTGNFNSIKGAEGVNNAFINRISYYNILKYTAQCFVYSPKASLEALAKLTRLVWGIDTPNDLRIASDGAKLGGEPGQVTNAARFMVKYERFFSSSGIFKAVFGSYGIQIIILLSVGMIFFAKRRISIIHALPLFSYNFGTMLLLSGSDYRFFVYNIPVWLAVLFLMVKDKTKF